jgi:hypothetical protein
MALNLRFRPSVQLLLLLFVLGGVPAVRLMAQATGTVTGTVTDTTGGLIPGAAVTLTNASTGIAAHAQSNGDGAFSFAAVLPGLSYKITVSAPGFRPWESQPFAVRPGDEPGFKAKLQVASVNASVTVEATSDALEANLDNGERSDIISAKDLDTLSIVGRDATELVRTLPGYSMSTGDQGLFNRPGYNAAVVGLSGPTGAFSANGAGPTGIAVLIDGISLTDIATNSGSVQQINADMVADVKATSSSFSAISAKGPAMIAADSKTGGSKYHGEAYFIGRDTVLNSNDWYDNYLQQSRPAGSYYFPGGQIGGPLWLPFTSYNRNHDKIFFFAGFEYSNQSFEANQQALASWVPTASERLGDFSADSLNSQLCGTRPDGLPNPNSILPMCYIESYLPSGQTVANNNAAPYAAAGGPAFVNWLPKPNADPFTNIFGYNYIQQVIQHQNVIQFHGTLQYNINSANSLFFVYGLQREIDEDPVSVSGYVPTGSIPYPGQITTGDISSILAVHYTHTFTSNLTNQLSAAMSLVSLPGKMGNPKAVSRWYMNDYNGGNGNFDYLGMYKNGGDYSVPALSDYNSDGYPSMQMVGGFYNNQVHTKKTDPLFQDDLTWQFKNHTFQFGVYYEEGVYNGIADTSNAFPQGEFTFNPGNGYFEYNSSVGQNSNYIGCTTNDSLGNNRLGGASYLGGCINPTAMMYTGSADSFTQTNFTPTVDMRYRTISGYANDHWKFHRLTLDIGARVEHLGPWTDKHNNGLATFSDSLYNQDCSGYTRNCVGNVLPGLAWNAIDKSTKNSVNAPSTVYISPRAGASIDLYGDGKSTLRGGGGIYRNQEQFNPYALAGATAQGYQTTYVAGTLTYAGIDSQTPIIPPDFSAYVLSPKDTNRPIYYEYNMAVDQMVGGHGKWSSMLEFAYVGSHNVNLGSYNNSSYNSASDLNVMCGIETGCPTNQNPQNPKDNLFYVDLGNVPEQMTNVQGVGTGIGSLDTQEQDFFRRYPFYEHIYELKHNFYSNYNSLQIKWEKNAGFLTYRANYTFAKNLATAASYNNNIVDPVNLRNDYGPTPYDRTQVFNISYFFDPSQKWKYQGGSKLVSALVNQWQISGITTLQSGFPLAAENGENFGFGYGGIYPVEVANDNQYNPQMQPTCLNTYNIESGRCVNNMNPTVWLGTPDVQLMPTVLCNPAAKTSTANQFINPTCFGLPYPETNGTYRLPYIRGPRYIDHDITLLKNFSMGEGKRLQVRAAGFNFLNHPLVSFNQENNTNLQLAFQNAVVGQALTTSQITHQDFGIANIKVGSRLLELGAKFFF